MSLAGKREPVVTSMGDICATGDTGLPAVRTELWPMVRTLPESIGVIYALTTWRII
jgi:hypothetical protein